MRAINAVLNPGLLLVVVLAAGCGHTVSAVDEPDAESRCEDLATRQERQRCLIDKALAADDPSLCVQGEPQMRNACWQAFALQRHDPDLCAKIDTQIGRDLCAMETAISARDVDVCARIRDATTRLLCIESVQDTKPGPTAAATAPYGAPLAKQCVPAGGLRR